jgi:ribose-phosphate pyrophosphokinase
MLIVAMPGNEALAAAVADQLGCGLGALDMHQFPDGEHNPRFACQLAGHDVVLVCTLDRPDEKVLPLYLAAKVARELGARRVGLLLPYLAYMRQDARFREGEGITSVHFAALLSACADFLVTADPHLHRHRSLGEIYPITTRVVAAAPAIASWLAKTDIKPVLIGPDEESAQWVADIAARAHCPYFVLSKVRSGDSAVRVSSLSGAHAGCTPVLIDDIASTGRTMIAAIASLHEAGWPAPVCIAVHALFCGDAYEALESAGAARIVSCNTVVHVSNQIDLNADFAGAILMCINDLDRGGAGH